MLALMVFLLSKENYSARTNPYHSVGRRNISFTAGTTIIPVKLRWQNNFEFTPDVGLGAFAGLRTRISHYQPHFVSMGFTAGISAVAVSPFNSPQDTVLNIAAFTLSLGTVFEFRQVQVGCFLGWDHINGNNNRDGSPKLDWDYHGRPWWSIGLGYSLLTRPPQIEKSKGKNTNGKGAS